MRVLCKPQPFGKWCALENLAKEISKTAGQPSSDFPIRIVDYCSAVLRFGWISKHLFWMDAVRLFYLCMAVISPKKIPLLDSKSNKDDKPPSWDYAGRTYYFYVHLLADKYGWTKDYIDQMKVNDVFPLVQEILTHEQLEREFQYSLSEVAYPYNKSTKKNEFKPMERPYWMWMKAPEIKKIKIPKAFVPVGVVQDAGGMEKYIRENSQTKPV